MKYERNREVVGGFSPVLCVHRLTLDTGHHHTTSTMLLFSYSLLDSICQSIGFNNIEKDDGNDTKLRERSITFGVSVWILFEEKEKRLLCRNQKVYIHLNWYPYWSEMKKVSRWCSSFVENVKSPFSMSNIFELAFPPEISTFPFNFAGISIKPRNDCPKIENMVDGVASAEAFKRNAHSLNWWQKRNVKRKKN